MKVYLDFISPYAWLAWKRLPSLAARHGEPIEPIPVLLAALLDHWGQLGPAEIPPKREWVFRNVSRLAARAGLSLRPPPAHPFNPLLALRVAAIPGPDQARVIDALFDATWTTGGGVADAHAIIRALVHAGLDPTVVDQAGGQKDRLRANCDEAIRAGVFGVPTVRVHEELFFGYDALPDLEEHLRGHRVDAEQAERWRLLPSGATRRPTSPHHGLSHASVCVANLERTVRFYAALGYHPYFEEPTEVQLVRKHGTDVLAFVLDPARAGQRGSVDHLGFRLRSPDRLDEVLAGLLGAGGRLLRRGAFSPGMPYAYVADPDGHEVEIWFEPGW